MGKTRTRAKGVYGKPLSKASGQQIPLTRDQLNRMAKIILESIKDEIKSDIAKTRGLAGSGNPVVLPNTARFPESWKYRIKGDSTMEFYTDWPVESFIVEPSEKALLSDKDPGATKPFKMTWLNRQAVPYARIVQEDGKVVVRMTPDPRQGQQFWVHPGFKRYSFLQRGIRKGRQKAIEALVGELVEGLLSEYDFFG